MPTPAQDFLNEMYDTKISDREKLVELWFDRIRPTQVLDEMHELLRHSQGVANETSQVAPNSYGAGFDSGFVSGLAKVIDKLERGI